MKNKVHEKTATYSIINEIKNRLSIVDVLFQHGTIKTINLKRTKRKAFNINCPFHEDRSPSFTIWPQTKSWKCHAGCGGGDVINLVSKLRGISNTEARIMLQKQLGIENKWSATDYSNWQNDREFLRVFEETKDRIVLELLHLRNLFNKAMKQVVSFEDIDRLFEVYHFKPMIGKYLEELDSIDFEIQVSTIKYLKPLLLGDE
jgi:hypothetical protein